MWIAVATVVALSACTRKLGRPMPEPEPVMLEIHNHGFFDMDVFVVPSPSSASSLRLTTVSGFESSTVTIRNSQLQPGGVLQVALHPIGSRARWTSPALAVSPGEHVALDIYSDAAGNLNRTVLYPVPDTTGGAAPFAVRPR